MSDDRHEHRNHATPNGHSENRTKLRGDGVLAPYLRQTGGTEHDRLQGLWLIMFVNRANILWSKTILSQRTQCRHQVNMRVAANVMIRPIGSDTSLEEISPDKIPDQFNVLLTIELHGKRKVISRAS